MKEKKVVIDLNHILYPSIQWLLVTFVLLMVYLQIYKKFVMNSMFYLIMIISLLMLGKVIAKLIYVSNIASKNTVYFSKPKPMMKPKKLPDKYFPKSDNEINFYYQMNLYLPDYLRNLGQYKNIFMKGTNPALACPAVYFAPNTNNIIIIIYCDNNEYDMVTLENIPLRRWFNFSFYVNNQNLEIYMNGELVKSSVLRANPVTNNNFVTLSHGLGFDGMLNNFLYSNTKMSPLDIKNLYNVFKKIEHPDWLPFNNQELKACQMENESGGDEDEDVFGTFGKNIDLNTVGSEQGGNYQDKFNMMVQDGKDKKKQAADNNMDMDINEIGLGNDDMGMGGDDMGMDGDDMGMDEGDMVDDGGMGMGTGMPQMVNNSSQRPPQRQTRGRRSSGGRRSSRGRKSSGRRVRMR